MHGKKGQVSPVFKYMFAIIAGVLFLSFFVGFAMQHRGQQSKIETGRILFGFDDLLTLFSTSGDASIIYPEQGFPSRVELNFLKDKIVSGTISKTTTKIVFSENQLRGEQFYIWTKRWKMPFTVDNMYYISDGRVPIYIVYDSDSKEMAEELTDKFTGFPNMFEVDRIHEDQLDAKAVASLKARAAQSKKMRFITLNINPQDLQKKTKAIQNSDIVEIEPSEADGEKDWDFGKVKYEDGENTYLGREMLLGAIVSEDEERYQTSKERAMDKLATMARLYENKAQLLNAGSCQGQYTGIIQALKELASAEPTEGTLVSFASKVENLKDINRELESGCPEVF